MKKIFITLCATLCTVSVFAQQLSDSSNNMKIRFTWGDNDNSVVMSSQLAGTKWQRIDMESHITTLVFYDSTCIEKQVLSSGEQTEDSCYYYLTLFEPKQHDATKVGKKSEGHYINFYSDEYGLISYLITKFSQDSLILDEGMIYEYDDFCADDRFQRYHRIK